ncbi:MAG: hypothetical protein IT330_00705 [Anaerolineae bacterium]|nr:hypothetical protein [Anaerolineae bacterium]
MPAPTDTPVPTVATTQSAPADTPQAAATATPVPSPTVPPATPTPRPTTPANTPTPTGSAATVSFAKDVLPLLERRCVKCHGGEKTEEGLVLKTYADVMKGSNNGPVINPGNVTDSFLNSQIVKGEMPKRQPRLLESEIKIITAWVEAGAPDN